MIRTSLLAATALTLLAAPAFAGQTQTAQPAVPVPMDIPVLANAQISADCGNLYQMAGRAYCLTAPLAGIANLADTYSEYFRGQGWLAAAGEENRVVFVKRRDGGGCDGLQMVAFYDTSRPAGPEAAGYLAFATIPGNICAVEGAAATPTP